MSALAACAIIESGREAVGDARQVAFKEEVELPTVANAVFTPNLVQKDVAARSNHVSSGVGKRGSWRR